MLEKDDLIYTAGELAEKGEIVRLEELLYKEARQHKEVIQQVKDHALRLAAQAGKIEVVLTLLQKGANPNVALMFAAAYGKTEVVELLIEFGANVSEHDSEAVIWAIKKGHSQITKILFEAGAKIDKGYAKKIAMESGNEEIISLVEKYL